MEISSPPGANSAMSASEGAVVSPVSLAVQGVIGAWVQVIAACAHTPRGLLLTFVSVTASKNFEVWVGSGAGGAEVAFGKIAVGGAAAGQPLGSFFIPISVSAFVKASRFAIAVANMTDAVAATLQVGATVVEAND